MADPGAPAPAREHDSHRDDRHPAESRTPVWYVDEIVVAAFAFLGIGGAVFLPLRYALAPIVVSYLLATGLAALTYKYLGGIESSSAFAVGALRLTGSLGALVGIAMLINSQLVSQTNVQVWYLRGKVVTANKEVIDELKDADFTVFPANAHAEQLGDFHIEFIRHNAEPVDNRMYLSVNHPGFGPVIIPLDVGQLKQLYPDATVEGRKITIDHIVILPEARRPAPYTEAATPLRPLTSEQQHNYEATANSAPPAGPDVGGVPR